jgi:hypothetical protein
MQCANNNALINALGAAADDTMPLRVIDATNVGINSDHIPFWSKSVPATSILAYRAEARAVLASKLERDEKFKQLMACSTANKPTDVYAAIEPEPMVEATHMILRWIKG